MYMAAPDAGAGRRTRGGGSTSGAGRDGPLVTLGAARVPPPGAGDRRGSRGKGPAPCRSDCGAPGMPSTSGSWPDCSRRPRSTSEPGRNPPETIDRVKLVRARHRADRAGRVPFFRRLWDEHGFDPRDLTRIEDLDHVPTYTVDDLRRSVEEHPPYGDYQGVSVDDALREPLRIHLSGGTSRGAPAHALHPVGPRGLGGPERPGHVPAGPASGRRGRQQLGLTACTTGRSVSTSRCSAGSTAWSSPRARPPVPESRSSWPGSSRRRPS